MLKLPLASEFIMKRKFLRDLALVGQNVRVHSGHIHVSFVESHFAEFNARQNY